MRPRRIGTSCITGSGSVVDCDIDSDIEKDSVCSKGKTFRLLRIQRNPPVASVLFLFLILPLIQLGISPCNSWSLASPLQRHSDSNHPPQSSARSPTFLPPLASSKVDSTPNERNTGDMSSFSSSSSLLSSPSPSESPPPLFSVGMIADIQYAPIPDGFSFTGTPRYYRHALEATKRAFDTFRTYKNGSGNGDQNGGVHLVVNLGDIIDGKCQEIERHGGDPREKEEKKSAAGDGNGNVGDHPGMRSLLEVESAMGESFVSGVGRRPPSSNPSERTVRVLHTYGNHCLYNLNRAALRSRLGIPFRREDGDLPPPSGRGTFYDLGHASCSSSSSSSIDEDSDNDNDNDNDNENDKEDLVGYYSYVYPPQHEAAEDMDTPADSTTTTAIATATATTTTTTSSSSSSIKFVVLDGYDISLTRRCPKTSAKRSSAATILETENGINFRANNENSPEGLEGLQKRFVAFNGAVGESQLEWLQQELEATRQLNASGHTQRVVVVSHQPIHPGSSNPVCLIWNYERVLQLLRDYSDVVVASFAGHAHKGGYVRDESSGIHFRVVEAVLESKPPTATFGVLEFYDDRLVLEGYGDCESAVYRYEQ